MSNRIHLLGRLDVWLDGAPVPPPESPRAAALLAYLLLNRDEPQPRQRVAGLFWPDSTTAQARTNLRHLLHTLRAGLPGVAHRLEITAATLRWRTEDTDLLDVAEFDRLLAIGGAGRVEALREAVALYRGDLLEGCDDEWLSPERDRLRQRYLDALDELAHLHHARGEPALAIAVAQRLLEGAPLREQTYRLLMRAHAARGDRARALAVYHDCCSTLERELAVRPDAETRAVYADLLPGEPSAAVAAAQADRAPLVGRDAERRRLTAAWRSAELGRAGLVLVSGEPGVGKTRLVEEFRAWCARRGAVVADARSYAAEAQLPYEPLAQWLRSPALRARLPQLDRRRLTELTRVLPELQVEVPGLDEPEVLPEDEQRHRLHDAASAAILASTAPVLLVFDDLQHGDPETCSLLHYLLRVHPDARLLVAATARREEIGEGHPVLDLITGLHARERCVEMELGPLDRRETALLAERLTGAPLPADELDRLHAETEGNALFVVESARAGRRATDTVSPRVQAVIESRLSQLSRPARELVDVAALIGREFDADVLTAAAGVDDDVLVGCLDELWRRRIIRERGAIAYDFGHDKIREVAARTISPARRRVLHLRIAAALEGGDSRSASAQIAGHYARAGAADKAVRWYRRAAEAAQLLHANLPAVELLERALGQLRALPGSPARDAAELDVCMASLAPLAAIRGYASPAIATAQQRAQELSANLGRAAAPTLLRSLALTASTTADFPAAMRIGHRLRAAGERDGDDVLLVEGAFVLGVTAFWTADFETARGYLELAVRQYRAADRHTHVLHYGNDPKVSCLSRLGNTHWFLGDPAAARAARSDALDWAEEIGHGYSRGIARWFGALLALDMGDEDLLRTDTDALSAADESRQLELGAAALRGYLAVVDGGPAEGITAVRAAIDRGSDAHAPGLQASLQRILLAAHIAAGDDTGAVEVADRLLTMGAGAQVWEPEARRVRDAFRERIG